MSQSLHPCVTCGVCCTNYRVEFSVYELQSMGGTVPDHLAHEAGGNRARMNGTERRPVRCTALTGRCGEQVLKDDPHRVSLFIGGDPHAGLAHEEAAVAPRFHQPLREQLVVGGDHGRRAHALLLGALAFAGHIAVRAAG